MRARFALVHADVWTMADPSDRAEAFLVEDGRVRAVGEERAILRRAHAEGFRVVDAHGRWVTPGLIDSHTHLVHQGLLGQRPDLWDTPSLEAALARVRRAAAAHRGTGLLIAERWDESRWKGGRFPVRDDLDAISRKVPIVLRRVDGHVAVGNTLACDLIAKKKLPGVHTDSGLLIEEASLNLNQAFPTPAPECVRALGHAQDEALRLGVTTVHDFVVPTYLRAYQRLHARGALRIRAHLSLYVDYLDEVAAVGLEAGFGDAQLRFHGIKLFADGSFGGHTAALKEPYTDRPASRGRLNFSDGRLATLVRAAHDAGLPVSAHAIGDAAIEQVAAAFAATPTRRRAPHRIEHFELPTAQSLRDAARSGVVLSMQPNFLGEWARPGGMYHDRVGGRRVRGTNEFAKLWAKGLPLAFGSDCMPFDPWRGLDSCVRAPYPSQRLPLERALFAYTRGSAAGLGRQADLGALRPGAWADFVILGRKPRNTGRLDAAGVQATYIAGEPKYRAGGPLR